jgi:hypothetical protein
MREPKVGKPDPRTVNSSPALVRGFIVGRIEWSELVENTCVERLYVGTRILPKYKERLRKELKDVSMQIFEMSVSNYNHEWVKL